jgi:hypothetical protein
MGPTANPQHVELAKTLQGCTSSYRMGDMVTASEGTALGICGAIGFTLVALLVVLPKISKARKATARRKAIIAKFGAGDLAERIIVGQVWTGETAEQLTWSLGPPIAVEEKVLKTKRKQVWKYGQTGVNRFSVKVTLENDIVVGWDSK